MSLFSGLCGIVVIVIYYTSLDIYHSTSYAKTLCYDGV